MTCSLASFSLVALSCLLLFLGGCTADRSFDSREMGVSEAFKRVGAWSESFAFTWSWGCYLCPSKGSGPFVRGHCPLVCVRFEREREDCERQENSPINVVWRWPFLVRRRLLSGMSERFGRFRIPNVGHGVGCCGLCRRALFRRPILKRRDRPGVDRQFLSGLRVCPQWPVCR